MVRSLVSAMFIGVYTYSLLQFQRVFKIFVFNKVGETMFFIESTKILMKNIFNNSFIKTLNLHDFRWFLKKFAYRHEKP